MNYTYILECGDKSLYTGWTTDLKRRLRVHNQGKGARYTRSRLPVRLLYYEVHMTKEEAMKREYAIKQLTHTQKMNLIEQGTIIEWKNVGEPDFTGNLRVQEK